MSDFSSLKTVPSVFQKPNLEKAWQNLRHPFSLAIFASLGVHGLLWFGLPLVSFSNAKQPNERSLEVIELSQLEQARLPDTSLSLPLKPAPDDVFNTKLPDLSSSNPLSTPANPTLNDPIPLYEIPGLSATSGPIIEPNTQQTRQSSSNTDRTTSSRTTREETKVEVEETEVEKTDEPVGEPKTEEPPVSRKADDLKTSSGEDLSVGESKQQQALQQKYAYSSEGTSDADILQNAQIASQTISEKFAIRDWEKPIAANAVYPQEACQFQPDGKPIQGATKLAVVLQPDGQLADFVLMLGASGYKGLDEAAVQFVKDEWEKIASQNKIEPGSNPKAFPLSIKFDPAEADCANAQRAS